MRPVRVTLDAAGRIHVAVAAGGPREPAVSRFVSWAGLRDALVGQAAADPAPKDDDGACSRRVVLRVDRAVPWGATAAAMSRAADPKVRAFRVLFAVLPESGDEEGVVAAYLPKDRGNSACGTSDDSIRDVAVRIAPAPAGADGGPEAGTPPAHVAAALAKEVDAARADKGRRVRVKIEAAALAPTGAVLEVLDAALRAGVHGVLFVGVRLPDGPDPVARFAADARAAPVRAWRVHVGLRPVAAPAATDRVPEAAGRSLGRLAGSFDEDFLSAGGPEEDVLAKDPTPEKPGK